MKTQSWFLRMRGVGWQVGIERGELYKQRKHNLKKKSSSIIHWPNASSLPVIGVDIGPGHFQSKTPYHMKMTTHVWLFLGKKKVQNRKESLYHTFLGIAGRIRLSPTRMLSLEQHGMHQGDPVVGGGQSLQKGLGKDPGGGTCLGVCLEWSIFTEVANCEAANCLITGLVPQETTGIFT